MTSGTRRASVLRVLAMGVAIAFVPVPGLTFAQGLTGAIIGTVTDAQGGVLSGAIVRSGYERAEYRDFTIRLAGMPLRERTHVNNWA